MTDWNDILPIVFSFFSNTISILYDIFIGIISALPIFLSTMLQLISLMIVYFPIAISLLFFIVTHIHLLFILIEAIILCKVIVTRGFFEKLTVYYSSHIALIFMLINAPKTLSEIYSNMQNILTTIINTLSLIWSYVNSIVGWLVQSGSNAATGGLVVFAILIIFVISVVSLLIIL